MRFYHQLTVLATCCSALKIAGITWNAGSNRLRRIPTATFKPIMDGIDTDSDIVVLALQETTFGEKRGTFRCTASHMDPEEADFANFAAALVARVNAPMKFVGSYSQPFQDRTDFISDCKMGKTAIGVFVRENLLPKSKDVRRGRRENKSSMMEAANKGSATLAFPVAGKKYCFTSIHQSFKGSAATRVASLDNSIQTAAAAAGGKCDEHFVLGDVNSRFHCLPVQKKSVGKAAVALPLSVNDVPNCAQPKVESSLTSEEPAVKETSVCNYMANPANYAATFCGAPQDTSSLATCQLADTEGRAGAAQMDELENIFAAYKEGRSAVLCGKVKDGELKFKSDALPAAVDGRDTLRNYKELDTPNFAASYKRKGGNPEVSDDGEDDDSDDSTSFLERQTSDESTSFLQLRTAQDKLKVAGSASAFKVHIENNEMVSNLAEWKHNPAYTDRILLRSDTAFTEVVKYVAIEGLAPWNKDGTGSLTSSDHIPVLGIWKTP